MNKHDDLFLYEELMLLAIKDEEGTFEGTFLEHVISAAILAELLMQNRIVVGDDKKKIVELKSSDALGDPIVDECLEKITQLEKALDLKGWIYKFARIKELRHRIARQLCDRGILRADEDKVLWIFTRKIYPETNHEPEQNIINRLKQAIFSEESDIDPRTVVLISLAKNANVLHRPFEKAEFKQRKKRIEQIINGEVTGKAAQEVIAACQTAIMVAAIIPAVTTAAIHH